MTLAPRDAHLADPSGPAIEARPQPQRDFTEDTRGAPMIGLLLLMAMAFVGGYVLGAVWGAM